MRQNNDYPLSAKIGSKQYYPCDNYEFDCRECPIDQPELPPHCAVCGYVKEEHNQKGDDK